MPTIDELRARTATLVTTLPEPEADPSHGEPCRRVVGNLQRPASGLETGADRVCVRADYLGLVL